MKCRIHNYIDKNKVQETEITPQLDSVTVPIIDSLNKKEEESNSNSNSNGLKETLKDSVDMACSIKDCLIDGYEYFKVFMNSIFVIFYSTYILTFLNTGASVSFQLALIPVEGVSSIWVTIFHIINTGVHMFIAFISVKEINKFSLNTPSWSKSIRIFFYISLISNIIIALVFGAFTAKIFYTLEFIYWTTIVYVIQQIVYILSCGLVALISYMFPRDATNNIFFIGKSNSRSALVIMYGILVISSIILNILIIKNLHVWVDLSSIETS
ncbi:hypothetical protein NEIRO02_1876 [Nematocida sp. AWRm79]|nr:hypothetical protein NEIRO02_1876 [Nematocida sp. AWRm79]